MLINDVIKDKISSEDISDDLLKKLSYAIEFFEFWGHVSDEDRKYWFTMQPVLMKRLNDMKPKKNIISQMARITKALSGQLWESCHRCKSEGPVYMSHDCLCENCVKGT